jgi:predicted aspartyl protease
MWRIFSTTNKLKSNNLQTQTTLVFQLYILLNITISHNKPKAEVHTGAIMLTGPREAETSIFVALVHFSCQRLATLLLRSKKMDMDTVQTDTLIKRKIY